MACLFAVAEEDGTAVVRAKDVGEFSGPGFSRSFPRVRRGAGRETALVLVCCPFVEWFA